MTSSMTGFRPNSTATGFKEKVPSGYRAGSIQQFTPEQMQLFSSLFSHVGPESYLSQLAGGDEETFQRIERPAHRQFASQIAQLGSRYSGLGGRGALSSQKSSGFQNELTAAGSNFAQDLASRRQDLQRQALYDLMSLSNTLLGQRPFQRTLVPKQEKSSGLGGIVGAGLGGIGGFFAGGPAGALTGASIGYGIGSGGGSSTQFQSSPDWNFNNALPLIGGAI